MDFIIVAICLCLTFFGLYHFVWNKLNQAHRLKRQKNRLPTPVNVVDLQRGIEERRKEATITHLARKILQEDKKKLRALETDPCNLTTKIPINMTSNARLRAFQDYNRR